MGSNTGSSTGLPVGTVTFLLTDIEASSRGWESDPGSMAKVVARHYEILDEAIARHDGARPQEQGEGDSVVAAFSRSASAVACALEIQRAMVDEMWPEGATIRLRIGLHTGDARLRDEGNYFGETVVRCARLRAVAHGGQVVLSRATEQLVVDHLPDGATLKDLGAHRLKDLTRPEQVFQLCHPDVENDFPPLRSLDALPNNLPLQLTSFIGREDEIATVVALLAESRLVTLTGAGGSGKTRLALQVAAEVLETQSDGAWWVDLAPLADPDLVPNAVAVTLSVREVQDQSVTETLVRRLHDHRAVILLDNCEHLIDACAELAEALLLGCPQVSLVATSREPLGVDGEIFWRVPSLSLPARGDHAEVESLTQCESVRLFIDRAMRVRPNFAVTNQTARAVAEICHRLDGIPLAIELAAARVRLLTAEQIVAGLADRFRLLTGGRRTALPRQRTLEASVEWSYNLLSEAERGLLQRLSVFAGGFRLDAAEDVCAGEGIERIQVLDLLSSLVDRSLVQVEEGGTEARYRLLETIRAYARQKLAEVGDASSARDRHLEHFCVFAERVAPELERGDQLIWLGRLEADIDNLRAALDWASESLDSNEALRLAASLTRYWVFRSNLTEAERRLDEALSSGEGTPGLRARALAWRGYIAAERSDLQQADDFAGQALATVERSDPEVTALALFAKAMGALFVATGDERVLLERTIAAAKEADLPSVLARALGTLGYFEMRVGNAAAGQRIFGEALAAARRSGDRFAHLIVGTWMGIATAHQGDVTTARAKLEATLEIARDLHTRWIIASCLSHLSNVETIEGEYESAHRSAEEARSVALEIEHPVQIAISQFMFGEKEYATGNLDAALSHFEQAIERSRSVGFTLGLAPAIAMRAIVSLAAGDREAARTYAEEGVAVGRQTDYPWALGLSLHCLAGLAFEEGDLERAEDLEHGALIEWRRMDRRPGIADALEALARIACALESDQEATRLAAATQRIREEIRYVRFPIDRPGHEELVGRLRERLGDEAFEATWVEGAALDLDAAVAYAARGRGERKRPSIGWASLTPTEIDVVRLAAEGLTNPQIAERLFVSRGTVKVHLGHIFAKLGVSTRAELAAEAARRGI
jgi:predicted ATPase/class 3 adenylate cyclase/DNA-binding CsgD family transcriptional regulator